MTLNNRGFAITGILYTLLVLFLLLLVSILGALSSRKNMLERSTLSLEDSYKGIVNNTYISTLNSKNIFPVTGKYTFKFSFSVGDSTGTKTLNCSTYAKKGASYTGFKNLNYLNVDCNTYKGVSTATLIEVISFEEE